MIQLYQIRECSSIFLTINTEITGYRLEKSCAKVELINIERRLRQCGDTRKWSTINKQLSTHQRTTVVFTDSNNIINHLRVSGMPEIQHQEIYKLLHVKDTTKRMQKMSGTRL